MVRFLKPGKVVIITRGKYAGRKAVIVKNTDQGEKGKGKKPFAHATVVGIGRCPRKVTMAMTKKQIAKKSTVKPFIRCFNYAHLFPTRYNLDIDFKNVDVQTDLKVKAKQERRVKLALQERYRSGKNKWFFTKLKF
uniref:KOW domain-containing protein n=1 Tax=Arcella intermedia TaxID=1963864 RepID=A0A6B2LQV3_9EUKA|eukprot:TRINITY_DN1780_c0_g1_i1.p1 TRINITY_DN1780_c0_g1~~TRINITY_DN1780_c0_g1_i1.p1  ORF type:complete len:136 (-),score=15.61 TRINITY_DN1780_c0_g1_i1:69-476(-)